jgi:quinoprotein glucose dehydrogenase
MDNLSMFTGPMLMILSFVVVFSSLAEAELKVGPSEWLSHGRDNANTKYSPLDQINAGNFKDVEVAWRWKSISGEVVEKFPHIRIGQFKPTPIVADGMMYVITTVCQIVALDAGTGEVIWTRISHLEESS